MAALEQVDAEEVGGRTLSLLRQWEHFNHFLKAKAAAIPSQRAVLDNEKSE
jgi:hypothetical protein